MNDDTRTRIIEAGAELIHLQGFQGTGLKAILDAANVPKGSFYHYFKSKEDFALAVIDYYGEQLSEIVLPIFNDTSRSAIERIMEAFKIFRTINEEQECTKGCLLANMSQEMSALSEPIRKHLDASYVRYINTFAAVIRQGQDQGEIRSSLDAKEAAAFIIASRNGAMIRMKVEGSIEPVLLFERMILQHFLSA